MNFLACDGTWTTTGGGIGCDGQLVVITSQEIAEEVQLASSLTLEEADLLIYSTLGLFAVVFGFLVLRKVF